MYAGERNPVSKDCKLCFVHEVPICTTPAICGTRCLLSGAGPAWAFTGVSVVRRSRQRLERHHDDDRTGRFTRTDPAKAVWTDEQASPSGFAVAAHLGAARAFEVTAARGPCNRPCPLCKGVDVGMLRHSRPTQRFRNHGHRSRGLGSSLSLCARTSEARGRREHDVRMFGPTLSSTCRLACRVHGRAGAVAQVGALCAGIKGVRIVCCCSLNGSPARATHGISRTTLPTARPCSTSSCAWAISASGSRCAIACCTAP